MAETVKNLTEKLQFTDILRKFAENLAALGNLREKSLIALACKIFANGFSVIRDCNPTLWEKVICITQPFDQRKSGKFATLNRQTERMMFMHNGVDCFCYFVDSGLYQSLRGTR